MAPEGSKPTGKAQATQGKTITETPTDDVMDTARDNDSDSDDEEVQNLKVTVQEMKDLMAANAKQTEERMQQLAEVCRAPRKDNKNFRPVPKGSPKNLSTMEEGKTLAIAQQGTAPGTHPGPTNLDRKKCPERNMTLAVAYRGYEIPEEEYQWEQLARNQPQKYEATCEAAVGRARENQKKEKVWFKGHLIPQEERHWDELEKTNPRLYHKTCTAAVELARIQAIQAETKALKQQRKEWQRQEQMAYYGTRQRRRNRNLCTGLATPKDWNDYEEAWIEDFPEGKWAVGYFPTTRVPTGVHRTPEDWESVPEGSLYPDDQITLIMAYDGTFAYDSDGHAIDSEEERYWQKRRGASLQEEIIPATSEDSEDDKDSHKSSDTQNETMADDRYGLITTYFRTNEDRRIAPEGEGDQEIIEKSKQRRDPGDAHEDLYIPALQLQEAMKYVSYEPWKHEEDDPRLDTDHDWHRGLSWVSCYWMNCPKHLGNKVKNNAFPIKLRGEPTTEPYEHDEVIEHEVTTYYPREKIARLERSNERYPLECYSIPDRQDTNSAHGNISGGT
ncbi:hypothetical protein S40285_10783 [Stachybotrys chlorohalonatus IBT 40285]|uniref:Uncharacterized protein n=1 Tax=Stachybotrys chlorohalonatus (strain IBT 40285) TaxID=1283841 RepID=A0A084Q817_STAC4|nr:hypothetical protein S40285_10783 [Stachybotrys chlorohalonata IBT 40285]